MLRAVIALAFVGLALIAFTFSAISDGKLFNAAESGVAGVVLIGASWLLAKRRLLRDAAPRRRRGEWVSAEEKATLAATAKEPSACSVCREEVVIGNACEDCSAAVHVDCMKRHRAEAHELSVGVFR
jgi:hypothetical protein